VEVPVLFVVVGLGVGFLSGILGIGGAVILVPLFVLVFGFDQAKAQGTSIGALLPPIGIFAAVAYYRKGLLDVHAAGLVALGFLFGALAGAYSVPYVPQIWLRRGFAALLAYTATQLALAEPGKKAGAVLPGMIAVAALWALYGLKRVLGKKPPRPSPPPPPADDIDFVI
jgi:hypothetical protein